MSTKYLWVLAVGSLAATALTCRAAPPQRAQEANDTWQAAISLSPHTSPDDPAVATVDGVPISASCIREQTWTSDANVALNRCIDICLLARAGADWLSQAQPGELRAQTAKLELAADFRAALASEFKRREFAEKITTADDLPPDLVKMQLAGLSRKFNQDATKQLEQPEFRKFRYLRIRVSRGVADALENAKAKAAIEALYKNFSGRRDILGIELQKAVDAANPEWGIPKSSFEVSAGDFSPRQSLQQAFATALFELPEPGMAAAPVRTQWGWDIVYLEAVMPATVHDRDKVVSSFFYPLRQSYYDQWVSNLASSLQIPIEIYEDALERIEAAEGP